MKHQAFKGIFAIVLGVGVIYAFVELRGPRGIGALLERRKAVEQLTIENQKLNREVQRQQDYIERLQKNPAEQEFEIRNRLKLAKPGEKIYILEPDAQKPDPKK